MCIYWNIHCGLGRPARALGVFTSSMQDRAVIGNHHAIVSSARDARHRRQLLARGRIPANLRVEERERPGEDVINRRLIQSVLHADQLDELPRPREPRETLFRDDQRSRRVRRAADGEIRQRDAVQPVLVAPERRQERLPEEWHIAHRRLKAPIDGNLGPIEPERCRQSGAAHQHQCFATHARPEASDLRCIDVVAPLRMREHEVERGRHRQRSQCLQRDEVAEMRQDCLSVREVVDLEVRKAWIAMERAHHDKAVAREPGQRGYVVVRDRAPAIAVRKREHRIPGRGVGEQRHFRAGLHVRYDPARWERVIGTGIVCDGRIAGDHDKLDRLSGKGTVEVRVVRRGHGDREGIHGIREQIGHVSWRAACRGKAFPVLRRVLAGSHSAEVLRDVAARHRVRPRERQRRHDGRRGRRGMRIAAAPAATGRDKKPTNQDCEKKTLFHHTPLLMSTFCSILSNLGLHQKEVQERIYLLKDHSSISPLRVASAGLLYIKFITFTLFVKSVYELQSFST